MKKILFAALMLLACSTMSAEVKMEGNTYVATKPSTSKVEPTKTYYKYKANDGNEYDIYITANGRAYIVKVSKKSGKEYKQYLGEEISRDICSKMGKEYKDMKKN